MTAIGKMLVFLVLVLSLVWNGLVLNAYVTRSNWRAESKKYQEKAVEAANSAAEQKKLLDAEREGRDDTVRPIREELASQLNQVKNLTASNKELSAKFDDKLKADAQTGEAVKLLQANLDAAQEQVKNLSKVQSQQEQRINELTLKAQRDQDARIASENREASQKRRADLLQEQNRILLDRIANNGTNPLNRSPAAPEAFRGTVTAFSPDGNFVVLEPGLGSGLQKGTVLNVQRITGGGAYLGTVRVQDVNAHDAVGQFSPKQGLSKTDYPRPGDELVGASAGR